MWHFPLVLICRKFRNDVQSSVISDYFHRIRWCHADFYILRNLQRLMLTGVLRSNSFKNFGKFLETHLWWKFILAKLLSCALHRARWNEGTAMCIRWAVCKKTLLLVLDLKINRYKSTNGFLRKISKYFFLRQSTPAMQLVPSS